MTLPAARVYPSLKISIVILIGVWALLIWVVNPVGEFMINDDWSFIRALENLVFNGKMESTGWGPVGAPAGPALIAHLGWGRLFTYLFGHSVTTLRLSVITMGILGSLVLLELLRLSGASAWTSLWGVLTLVSCPLFLLFCFSFMTDATFVSLAVFSVLLLHSGVEGKRYSLVAGGLLAALASILTRQIGVVLPVGFALACLMHPRGRELGRAKMLAMTFGMAVIPWLVYEYTLGAIGSTPITEHQVVQSVAVRFNGQTLLDFLGLVGRRLLFALGYFALFVSPVVALRYREFLQYRPFRYFCAALAGGLAVFETLLVLGILDPPIYLWRNTITDFGLGPTALKDTYVLGIKRTISMPTTLYYALVGWAALSLAGCFILTISSFTRMVRLLRTGNASEISFLTVFTLASGWMYLGLICICGFHDRYLLPLIMMGIVWIVCDAPRPEEPFFRPGKVALAGIPLVAIAVFTVSSLHDFIALKRSQSMALNYLLQERRVDPCSIDGGFEFNGYHCYSQSFRARPGLSWWWVDRENFVLTLGPLPGYRVVRTYPFNRYIGEDGAIHVLEPAQR
ncbi:MAG: glycosyltransferase family 39 protein [Pseudomonadota bacterium]